MQYSQEHLKTMVYAKFGGQTECIMENWKIENGRREDWTLQVPNKKWSLGAPWVRKFCFLYNQEIWFWQNRPYIHPFMLTDMKWYTLILAIETSLESKAYTMCVYLIIDRLVPSPSRYETRQWQKSQGVSYKRHSIKERRLHTWKVFHGFI